MTHLPPDINEYHRQLNRADRVPKDIYRWGWGSHRIIQLVNLVMGCLISENYDQAIEILSDEGSSLRKFQDPYMERTPDELQYIAYCEKYAFAVIDFLESKGQSPFKCRIAREMIQRGRPLE